MSVIIISDNKEADEKSEGDLREEIQEVNWKPYDL